MFVSASKKPQVQPEFARMENLLRIHALAFTVLLLAQPVSSTITMAGTGQHFASHPDRMVGYRWMEGVQYMARMQFIPIMDLCSLSPHVHIHQPHYQINITVPSDDLPVALLVQGDACLDLTQVDLILSNISPPGTVRYLIVYNNPSNPSIHFRTTPKTNNTDIAYHDRSLHGEDDFPQDWKSSLHSNAADSFRHVSFVQGDYIHHVGVLHVGSKTGSGTWINVFPSYCCESIKCLTSQYDLSIYI